MKNRIVVALALACVISSVVFAQAGTELNASWSKGIRLQSEDGNFKLKLGGRIQNDWAWFKQNDENIAAYGNWQDGTDFRRIRLYVAGTIYKDFLFKAQYDFAGSGVAGKEAQVKDMYMGLQNIRYAGTLLVGHQKEPFGLETLTSSKYVTFMERSPSSVFDSDRNSGFALHNNFANKRVTAGAGVFKDTDGGGKGIGDGRYAATGRVTGLPWVNDDVNGIFHLGGAYSYRNQKLERNFKVRPSSHLADYMVETGDINVKALNVFGGELAFVYGPFSLQSEYTFVGLEAPEEGDPSFNAGYAYASFFITGESRVYKKSRGVFDRVSPKENFLGEEKGSGAWEVAARYARVDLNDKMIYGGELSDVTVGLNWYTNPNTRIMFNYVFAMADNVGEEMVDNGAVNIFEMRFQIDF